MSATADRSQADPRRQLSGKMARPDPIIKAIESVKPAPQSPSTGDGVETADIGSSPGYSIKNHILPLLDLPGFGEKYDDCGDDIAHFCEECGHVQTFGRTCNRSQCPRCGAAWVLRASSGRGRDGPGYVPALEALRKERHATTPDWYRAKFHHLFISPNPGWAIDADDPLKRTVQVIKEIMDECRIQGYIFYHPYRGRDEERDGPDDQGEWKKRLFSGREWEDVWEELRYSGHFHVVGVSDYVKGDGLTDAVYDATGWVVGRIHPPGSSVSLYDLDSMARAVTYCASHTGLYETPSGNMRGAIFQRGTDLNGIQVYEETKQAARLAVRKAAPKTLGVYAPTLACDAAVPITLPDHTEDLTEEELDELENDGTDAVTGVAMAASGGSADGLGGGAPPEPTPPDPNSLIAEPANAVATNAGDITTRDLPTETCNGEYLSIGAAPAKLDDEEWVESAIFAEETRAALEKWREIEDWIG